MIRAAAFAMILAAAAACGQKGPLRLPDSKNAATPGTAPAAPPQPTPAGPAPATMPPSAS